MYSRRRFTAAAALLALGGLALAADSAPDVVAVRYQVGEQDPARLEEHIINRIERPLKQLPRVAEIYSTARHGSVHVEIWFDGGATGQDVAAVARLLDEAVLGEVTVISRTIGVEKPSPYFQLR